MAFGIGDILQSIQQLTQAAQTINQTLQSIFPSVTATSTRAPATTGTITFTSSQASFFILVETSSGFTGKVPIYPQ